MKRRSDSNSRRAGGSEFFGMSFLDVICCGFGAMVLLVLLSKTDVAGGVVDLEALKNLLGNIATEKQQSTEHQTESDALRARIRELQTKIKESPSANLAAIEKQLAEKRARFAQLRRQVVASAKSPAADAAAKVGGIPVDSDHVIFIVDTSGSMQQIWPRVLQEFKNVLDIHPKVKGFQVMNDNGVYLLDGYAGKWIPDSPGRRKAVLSAMGSWHSFSSSSPVEGIKKALRTYAGRGRTENLSIYIFGDEYSGASYDPVLEAISKLNIDPQTGRPFARIHGVGFFWGKQFAQTTRRFATLMREVARRNRGAFVALGK